jgi:hypothetical protein
MGIIERLSRDRIGIANQWRPHRSVSIINIRPHAMVAKTGMAMREGRRQRLSAIEQVEPPDHPLSFASPVKTIDNAARPTARAIAEIPRVRMIELEELPERLAMEPGMEPEPNSVANAPVPGLELTKKMTCNEG